jgi:hypothetical protein
MFVSPSWLSFPSFGGSSTKTPPPGGTYSNGYLPGYLLPAEHLNYFFGNTTDNSLATQDYISKISAELNSVLAAFSITPNPATSNQVQTSIAGQIAAAVSAGVGGINQANASHGTVRLSGSM